VHVSFAWPVPSGGHMLPPGNIAKQRRMGKKRERFAASLCPGTGWPRSSATPPRLTLRKCVKRSRLLRFCAFRLLYLFWFCVFRSLCLFRFCVSSSTAWLLRAKARSGCRSEQQKPAQQTNSHISLPSLQTFPGREVSKVDIGNLMRVCLSSEMTLRFSCVTTVKLFTGL
jgi:hypothetical protein